MAATLTARRCGICGQRHTEDFCRLCDVRGHLTGADAMRAELGRINQRDAALAGRSDKGAIGQRSELRRRRREIEQRLRSG